MPQLPGQAPGEHAQPTSRGRSAITPIRLVDTGCLVCFLLGIGCIGALGIIIARGTGDAKPDADAFLERLQHNDAATP